MKTYKKGISLIVLVVTVIVLAILATTVIISLSSTNIIEQANDAVNASNIANKKQVASVLLAEYQLGIANGTIPSSVTANNYVIQKLEEQEIDTSDVIVTENSELIVGSAAAVVKGEVQIGDVVNYNAGVATYTGKWRVLGVEGGQIILLSSEEIGEYELSGSDGYINGIKYLNEFCAQYGKGTGATGARSLTVEDINAITDYDFNSPYNVGKENEYGNTVTYTMDNGEIKFSGSNGVTGGGADSDPDVTKFTKVEDEQLLQEGEKYTVINNSYRYLATPTDNKVADIFYLPITENEKNLLVGENYQAGKHFWLASKCVITRTHSASWGLFNYAENWGGIQVDRFSSLFASWKDCPNYTGFNGTHTKYVRAVVYINPAVELVEQADGSWSLK